MLLLLLLTTTAAAATTWLWVYTQLIDEVTADWWHVLRQKYSFVLLSRIIQFLQRDVWTQVITRMLSTIRQLKNYHVN